MNPNLHFAASEARPQSIDIETLERIYDGDGQAIIDGLRTIVNFTFFNVPAMYRLDEAEDVLHAAAQYINQHTEIPKE